MTTAKVPTKIIVAVGTYDGVLAGWEWTASSQKLEIAFATAVHDGSVRSLSIAQNATVDIPGAFLSTGYDEVLKTHDFAKRLTSAGEVRTPSDLGTPVCAAFCPPLNMPPRDKDDDQQTTPAPNSTHCLAGFSAGQLVIYKKRDWSVQHVLKGHEGGVSSMAVHPTGSMALTGGLNDGKLKLWDLTKGRLAYNYKIQPKKTSVEGRTVYDAINCIVWNDVAYAFCYGAHLTVKDVASGSDLLDVELPSKINQICFLQGPEGLFVASANNDGSLAVLHVDKNGEEERRAIMAIEPVDGPVAGEERFKCLQQVGDYHVVTANSAGVISLMDLSGAVRMIMVDDPSDGKDSNTTNHSSDMDSDAEEGNASDSDEDDDNDDEKELAVDILDSVQLGSGNRVTCLAAWATIQPLTSTEENEVTDEDELQEDYKERGVPLVKQSEDQDDERKRKRDRVQEEMDSKALERARSLVDSAKKIRDKKHKTSKKPKKRIR